MSCMGENYEKMDLSEETDTCILTKKQSYCKIIIKKEFCITFFVENVIEIQNSSYENWYIKK